MVDNQDARFLSGVNVAATIRRNKCLLFLITTSYNLEFVLLIQENFAALLALGRRRWHLD